MTKFFVKIENLSRGSPPEETFSFATFSFAGGTKTNYKQNKNIKIAEKWQLFGKNWKFEQGFPSRRDFFVRGGNKKNLLKKKKIKNWTDGHAHD
jgi:hypothetical protein